MSVQLSFDGVEDYVPRRCLVLFKIYNRALKDDEVRLLYEGLKVVEPIAEGIALVKRYPDRTEVSALVVSKA